VAPWPPNSSPAKRGTALEHDQADLRRRIEELATGLGAVVRRELRRFGPGWPAEQNEAQSISASLQEQLDDVERALTRIDEGSYGLCEVCGKQIQEARLEAVPSATLCIDHA